MAPKEAAGEQTFDFETMAVVLYAMLESGVTLGNNHYALMSAADSKGRTANSFQHSFRKVKNRAKELQATKGSDLGAQATPKSRGGTGKRKKAASEMNGGADPADDDEILDTPSKKVKPEPKDEDDDDELR